jgi:ribosomal protein L37E
MLFEFTSNKNFDVTESSMWLTKGNNTPQSERFFSYVQDRNILFGEISIKCKFCKEKSYDVEHMATQCKVLLKKDYTKRHDEVLRCIHLKLCNEYGFSKNRRLRSHNVSIKIENDKAVIKVDSYIKTDINVKYNKQSYMCLTRKEIK